MKEGIKGRKQVTEERRVRQTESEKKGNGKFFGAGHPSRSITSRTAKEIF